MRNSEFVLVYPREFEDSVDLEARQNALDAPNRGLLWADRFGKGLHDYLSGRPNTEITPDRHRRYLIWQRDIARDQMELYTGTDEQVELRHRAGFHALNRCMSNLWEPLVLAEWTSRQRQQCLRISQDLLAFEGFTYYSKREKFIQQEGTPALFTPEVKRRHRYATGRIQEFDVGISVIHEMLHGDSLGDTTTIVPGPPQFEDFRRRYNADFLVFDAERERTIGLQVKSRLRRGDIEGVDQSRIVFVDGDADLNNVKLVRSEFTSSKTKVISWPGVIAAKKLLEIDPTIKGSEMLKSVKVSHGQPAAVRTMQRLKLLQYEARELLASVETIDMDQRSQRIGQRIAEKL
jgi:hypothetical protein